MNAKQKVILAIGAAAFCAMGVCPPWTQTFKYQATYSEKPAGYALVFSPPSPARQEPMYGVTLDSRRLLVQWAVLTVIVGVLWLTVKDSPRRPQP